MGFGDIHNPKPYKFIGFGNDIMRPGRKSAFWAGFRRRSPTSGPEALLRNIKNNCCSGCLLRTQEVKLQLAPKRQGKVRGRGDRRATLARAPKAWRYGGVRNIRRARPYEFIGFGAMDVTKPYRFILFGDIHGPKPNEGTGFWSMIISHTPVLRGFKTRRCFDSTNYRCSIFVKQYPIKTLLKPY
jgi:hypothetical protein